MASPNLGASMTTEEANKIIAMFMSDAQKQYKATKTRLLLKLNREDGFGDSYSDLYSKSIDALIPPLEKYCNKYIDFTSKSHIMIFLGNLIINARNHVGANEELTITEACVIELAEILEEIRKFKDVSP